MKKFPIAIAIYYCLIFASNGSYGSYIGLYYNDVGLDSINIGIISSLSALVAILVQPAWGIYSDRSKYKNNILILCIIMSTISIWLIPIWGNVFFFITIATILFTIFQCAINPLGDAMTLELASKNNFKFSNMRTAGSLGFALMSVVAGWMIQYGIHYIFVMYSAIMLLALCLTPFIPKVKGHQREGKKVKLIELFKNRKLVIIYIFSFLMQASLGFFFSFHAIYSSEQGISTDLVGLGLSIGSFSQFPFMIFFDKIYKKFGIVNILIFSGFIHAIRWVICAYFFTSQTILLTWILHGGTFMLFYLCLAEYVNTNTIDELKVSGQMMNAIVMQGLSKVIGSLLGGISASMVGLKLTFAFSAVFCFVLVVIFWMVVKYSSVFHEKSADQSQNDISA
jgi:PPP family 3-phenylpropionic acid transporter